MKLAEKYNESLKNYLQENFSQLQELSKERLKKKSFKSLDSKEEKRHKNCSKPKYNWFLIWIKNMFEDL